MSKRKGLEIAVLLLLPLLVWFGAVSTSKADAATSTYVNRISNNNFCVGDSMQLTYGTIPQGSVVSGGTWYVGDPTICSITQDGVLTALKTGRTQVWFNAGLPFQVTTVVVKSANPGGASFQWGDDDNPGGGGGSNNDNPGGGGGNNNDNPGGGGGNNNVSTGETLVYENGGFHYYNNGVADDSKYGFVDYNGSKFLVANGYVVSNKNGLVQDPDHKDIWYFCAGGKVLTNKSGLVQYPAGQDNWFIVQNGVMDSTYNGFAYYNGGLFFVARGKLVRKDGLVQDPHNKNDWYFLANGQVQSKKTGNVTYNGKTFYVSGGKLV